MISAVETELPAAFVAAWPLRRMGEALQLLARRSGLVSGPQEPLVMERELEAGDVHRLQHWFRHAADTLQVQLQPTSSRYAEVDQLAARCAPAIVRLKAPTTDHYRFLVILRASRKQLTVLTPDSKELTLPVQALREARFAAFEKQLDETIAQRLGPLANRLRASEQQAMRLRAEFRPDLTLSNCWLLRPLPGATRLRTLLRRDRVLSKVATLAVVHAGLALATILAWAVLGKSALAGHGGDGWHVAWALLVLQQVPLLSQGEYLQGVLGLLMGKQFKQHLLRGSFRMSPDEIRKHGSGSLLASVFESEAVELLALETGFQLFAIAANLVLVPLVLSSGAAPKSQVFVFAAFVVLAGLLAWVHLKARRSWTNARMGLTDDLIEKMVGQRTRLAQQPRERWHQGEDERLQDYVQRSKPMDRARLLLVYAPRAWLVLSLVVLGPAIMSGASASRIATSVGGTLLGWLTLQQLSVGGLSLGGAAVAWKTIAPLFRASRRAPTRRERGGIVLDRPSAKGEVVVQANELLFHHPAAPSPTLAGCSFRIHTGDRILLEGTSGSGKTTLASLLAGLRQPESGLLLLRGVDRTTLGDKEFRERIVLVPQFHENHIFSASLAFNLLMGRRWPADAPDFAEAEQVCRELGLGELLDRMPSGLLEMVGDAGWQLSHGEKSRVFLARALLQDADVVILDESFAALDPDTLEQAMACVQARARTLMLIAHP
ncbi:ABC transporter ATP-binding protein [Hyalangium rubrum]|uniref:ABC transporter ATP-binding protein n=1 Tax=Hyalangium rubrum TaxID=3103134 RepID=A0ABU5H3W5_9BACT|nr:ABC transporter ATP-binding protein [Hyalangium sp. s54d21]MDY7228158.1 ABC transporter ATP-binding protein [Hyalangium sp. s54d21]